MLGQAYLHWDGSYETYHAFFAHLRYKLDKINISGLVFSIGDLTIGSDDERALTKAAETFHKQLHSFAVDIFRKMCDNDCRIKSAFQRKCCRILPGVSLVLRDLQAVLTDDY